MSAPTTHSPGWLARQLPVVMQQDDFTRRFLAVFEEVADTLVHATELVAVAADPTLTPDPLVPWLGRWIASPAYPADGRPERRERDWLRAQSQALGARGTRAGLQCWLVLLSGGRPVEITDGGGIHREGEAPAGETAWVRVEMPLAEGVDAQHVLDLIRQEVPIGVVVDLVVLPSGPASIPRPRSPQEHETHWESVPGGPYFADGSTADLLPALTDEEPPEPKPVKEEPLSDAARRLPGTAGRAVRPGRICPACAEPHGFEALTCSRCYSALRIPRPVPVPEPEPVVEPLWNDDDRTPEPRIWPVVAVAVGLLLALSLILMTVYLLS